MQFGIMDDIGIIVQVPGSLKGIGVGAKNQQEQHSESDICIPFKTAVAIIGHRNCDLKTKGSGGYVYQLSIVNRTPDPQYQQFVATIVFVIWKTKRGSDASPFIVGQMFYSNSMSVTAWIWYTRCCSIQVNWTTDSRPGTGRFRR